MTILKISTYEKPYLAKESYGLIKKRIAEGTLFFEITLEDRKITINKNIVEEFGAYTPEKNPENIGKKKADKKA